MERDSCGYGVVVLTKESLLFIGDTNETGDIGRRHLTNMRGEDARKKEVLVNDFSIFQEHISKAYRWGLGEGEP